MFPPSKHHSRPTSFNRQTATPHCWHRKAHYCELSFSSMRHKPTEICYKTSTHICTLVLSQKPNPYMRFFKPNDSYSINSFSFQIYRSRFVGSSQKSWLVHRATLIFSLFFINFYWHTWLTSVGSLKKQESSRKISTSAILTMSKILTVWITTTVENSERDGNTRPSDLPLEKSVCRSGSYSWNWTWNSRLVPNQDRSRLRLYIVTLLT